MAGLKRRASQAWPEEHGEQEHGLYSLHRMFDIVGTHLTHRDVRVLSFLFVDVIDDHERGLIRNGRDFLLALERRGRCDERNFRQVLQLLRIITRHDLLPYVTLKLRRAVCPDLVGKHLEETSVRYGTPRALSDPEPRPPHPLKQRLPAVLWCAALLRALRCVASGQLEGEPHLGASGNAGSQPHQTPRKSRHVTSGCGSRLSTASTRALCRATSSPTSRTHWSASLSAFNQANTILKSRDLGSIICDIKFSELTYLNAFWRDYINGSLLEALKGVFITDSLKQAVGHEAIKLLVNVDKEDYELGRQKLLRNLMLQALP